MANQKKERQKANRASRLEQAQAEQAKAKVRQRMIGYGILAAVVIAAIAAIAWLAKDDDTSTVAAEAPAGCPTDETTERTLNFTEATSCIDETVNYTSVIETTAGTITIELDSEAAPEAVNNHVFLARHNFYDGVSFHRVIPGFVIQTGDAVGNPPGSGNPGYAITDELPTAEPFYEIGTIAMANSGPNSGGSQFFIVSGEQGAALDPLYSAFGQVVEGLDVVAAIEAGGSPDGTPVEEFSIVDVTILES